MGDTVLISLKIPEELKDEANKIVESTNKYTSLTHFIILAMEELIKKEKEGN